MLRSVALAITVVSEERIASDYFHPADGGDTFFQNVGS
jgi:hypothetical protein